MTGVRLFYVGLALLVVVGTVMFLYLSTHSFSGAAEFGRSVHASSRP
jgi:hypothetical protein